MVRNNEVIRLPVKGSSIIDTDDESLAWAVIELIWCFPTSVDHSLLRPLRWRFVKDGQLLVYTVTWLEREVFSEGLRSNLAIRLVIFITMPSEGLISSA